MIAALVPTSVRLELPQAPEAGLALNLTDPDLALLLIWSEGPADNELPEDLRELIAEELAYVASGVAQHERDSRLVQQLESLVGGLTQGVVVVDVNLDLVTLNPAAASLLHLAPGATGAAEFAAAMAECERRAVNGLEFTAMGRRLLADPFTVIECTWRFAEAPTHVRVSSRSIGQGVHASRIWVFEDVSAAAEVLETKEATRAASEDARNLLRANMDSMLDPNVLLEAVRDSSGRVFDFRYRSVNKAACSYLGRAENELLGHSQLEHSPNFRDSELQRRYIECLANGEPVVLDDYEFFSEVLDNERRLDVRGTKVGAELLSLTWSDVTDRFRIAQRVAESEALLRASADGMLNPQVVLEAVRDPEGRVVDFDYSRVNRATCAYLGLAEADLLGSSLVGTMPNIEGSGLLRRYGHCLETGEPVVLQDFSYFNELLNDDRRYDIQVTRAGPELLTLTWSDVTERFQAAQRIAESEQNYRLLAENAGDVVALMRDGKFAWVSPSIEGVLGAPPAYWIGRAVAEIIPPGRLASHVERIQRLSAQGVIQERSRVQAVDGRLKWIQLTLKAMGGQGTDYAASFRVIDAEVAAEQAAEEARARQAEADARFRRSMDNAAVSMCMTTPDGRFTDVNDAMCQMFGYDARNLRRKTWQDLTAPEYLQADLDNVGKILAGQMDSYRLTKMFVHADGSLIWGDLAVSCLRNTDGEVEWFIAQITDVTAEVDARQRLAQSDGENRALAQRLAADLDSAATYMASIMPSELTGSVQVVSRYLPSRELGGDCFDYTWLDDDHFLVYLIDVSGHGIEPALLSVSVHNMLRSRSLGIETMLVPDAAVTQLNRLFQMDQQGNHFFTVWYGVYQLSTRTLRYCSAGAPPAFVFHRSGDGDVRVTELSMAAIPVGMFDDTVYGSRRVTVERGTQILIFSDGAHELALEEGQMLSVEEFKNLNTQLAQSSSWSLDGLIKELKALTTSGAFEDDCSMIHLRFD